MHRIALMLLIALFLICTACADRGNNQEDAELAPVLFEESLRIFPDPAELYEDARFYFGWEDHDGDMTDPTITVLLINEAGDQIILDAENIEVQGEYAGTLSFTIRVLDGYQGEYHIVVQDDYGRQSAEISRFLYVNTEAPIDQIY